MDPFAARMKDRNGNLVYGMPVIITIPKVRVQRQRGGEWVTIDNPLYRFTMPQRRDPGMIARTDRNPGDMVRDTLNSYFSASVSTSSLGRNRSDPAPTLWRVLLDSSGQDWLNMSNHFARSGPFQLSGWGSLEALHDNVHVDFGRSMSDPSWAG
jgi:hypothetical protein